MFRIIIVSSIPRLSNVKNYSFYKFELLSRCIYTSRMKYAKAKEDLETNPFYDKYAQKISNLQKTSPEEFLSRLKANQDRKSSKSSATISPSTSHAGLPGKPKTNLNIITKPKLLSDVMKTELIEGKSADDIKSIWLEYHKNKDCIAASVPVSNFKLIQSRGEQFPLFLLPLPRDQGYEFILCQFSGCEVHFTPLISYQTHKENAPECLTIVYYPDLKESKGLILMRGEYNKDTLTAMEAQCLANELQLYYGEENGKRTRLLERFTNCPNEFRHMDLIANLESLSL